MSKQKKLYQKVNVKPKKFGNQNTNAINIIINPDENEGMYNKNPSSRPSNSSILNTIQQQPRELDPSSKQIILGRAMREDVPLTGTQLDNIENNRVNQEQVEMIKNQKRIDEFMTQQEQVDEQRQQQIQNIYDSYDRKTEEDRLSAIALQQVLEKGLQEEIIAQNQRVDGRLNDIERQLISVLEPLETEVSMMEDVVGKGEPAPEIRNEFNENLKRLQEDYNTAYDMTKDYQEGKITWAQFRQDVEPVFKREEELRNTASTTLGRTYFNDMNRKLDSSRKKLVRFISQQKDLQGVTFNFGGVRDKTKK